MVTNNLATGSNSLQQRLLEVCSDGIITFDNDYTIDLENTLIFPRNVTIDGTGFNVVINARQLFDYANADVVLDNVSIVLGDVPGD